MLGHGASIVRTGLVLSLDAGNSKSYPGSGTVWNDLSGNGNNGTLVNSPTFASGRDASFAFNGSTNYCEIATRNTNLEFQPSQPFTLSVWFKTTVAPTTGSIIANMPGSGTYPGYDLWFNGSNQLACHLISSWSGDAAKVKVDYNYSNFTNVWKNLSVTYDGSTPTTLSAMLSSMSFYIDGSLYTSGKAEGSVGVDGFASSGTTITYDASQRFRVASRWASGTFAQGSASVVSNVGVYNRALSATEIAQNFQALRGRYGV